VRARSDAECETAGVDECVAERSQARSEERAAKRRASDPATRRLTSRSGSTKHRPAGEWSEDRARDR